MSNECQDTIPADVLAENDDNNYVKELSRTEIQRALKIWGLRSGGTTVSLRKRYTVYRNSNDAQNHRHQPDDDRKSPLSIAKPSPAPTKKVALLTEITRTTTTTTTTKETITKKKINDDNDGTKKTQGEKRSRRYRTSCPKSIQQRIDRALTQRLFLIKRGEVIDGNTDDNDFSCDFHILGSTGNVYDVSIRKVANCSCPDHAKGNLCKHILFVLLKVMSLDPKSPLVYQAAWIESELRGMFEQMKQRYCQLGGTVLANRAVQESFAKLANGEEEVEVETSVARKQMDQEDDCPICFDALQNDSLTTVHCRGRCGANFHKTCIQHWLQQNRENPTCPMCRVAWEDNTSGNNKINSEGFSNLGKLQGLSSNRDMSSYSEFLHYSYKRRRY